MSLQGSYWSTQNIKSKFVTKCLELLEYSFKYFASGISYQFLLCSYIFGFYLIEVLILLSCLCTTKGLSVHIKCDFTNDWDSKYCLVKWKIWVFWYTILENTEEILYFVRNSLRPTALASKTHSVLLVPRLLNTA